MANYQVNKTYQEINEKIKKGQAVVVTAEEIIQYCAKNIASFKKPKNVEFINEFPRNPTGKILKKVLREKYRQGREGKV